MKQITDSKELREIQMDILSYVDRFCRDNDIQYSLCGGTLIGAIRHGGYIPWDDDIDIFMLRNDYDRFVDLFTRQDSKYFVHTFDNTKGYYHPYAMVSNTETRLFENGIKGDIGVNIDVFPVDYVPESISEQNTLIKKIAFIKGLFEITGLSWRRERALSKNLFMVISKILLYPFSRCLFSRKIDQIARKSSDKKTNKIGIIVWGYGAKEIIPASVFDSCTDIKFEHLNCRMVTDYHTYLKSVYGDYMQLPPEDKRVSHHVFKAYWKE